MALLPPVIAELRASTSDFQAKFAAAKATMEDLGGSASSLGSKISSVAQKITEFAAGAAAAVAVVSVKLAGDFQSAVEHLVTDAGESQAAIGLVTKGILDMAGTVGQTPQQLAVALYAIESSGYHAAAGLEILKAAAEGAAAGGTDTQTVVSALAPALHDYGLSAASAVSVTNELIAAVSQGNLHLADLAGALATVLPAAAAVHLSLAQVLGAVSTLTVAGTSANEATLMVADTIKGLSQPSNVARQALEQMGVSSVALAQNLGKSGLTGSIDEVVDAVLKHMGPSGLILEGAFNRSKLAAADLQTMLVSMPPAVRKLAEEYESGSLTMSQFRKLVPTSDLGMLNVFEGLYNTVHGFSTALKQGGANTTTFLGELSKVFGTAIAARTALELSGTSADYFANSVKHVSEAAGNTKTVIGFAEISKTFNFQLQQLRATAEVLGVRIGSFLIPKIEELARKLGEGVQWLERHRGAASDLAKVLGGVLATVVGITAVNALVKFERAGARALGMAVGLASKIWNLGQAATSAGAATEDAAAGAEAQGAGAGGAIGPTEGKAAADRALAVAAGAAAAAEDELAASEVAAGGGGLAGGVRGIAAGLSKFVVGAGTTLVAAAVLHKATEHLTGAAAGEYALEHGKGGIEGFLASGSKVPVVGSALKTSADLAGAAVGWWRSVVEHQGPTTETGYAPGVGKTYASVGPTLAQAQETQREQENKLLYLTPGMGLGPSTMGPVQGAPVHQLGVGPSSGPNTIGPVQGAQVHQTITVNVDARGATKEDATVVAMKTAEAVRVAGMRRARSTGNLLSTRAGTNVGSQR